MFVRETAPNTFVELDETKSIIVHSGGFPDVQHPPQVWLSWTTEQKEEAGIYRPSPFIPPNGYVAVGAASYSRVNGVVVQTFDVEPSPVPLEITRRQLLLALFAANFITSQEAVAAAQSGAVPSFIAAYFNAMQEPEKTLAIVTWASMSVCVRTDPLLGMLAASSGLTEGQLDDYFRYASTL